MAVLIPLVVLTACSGNDGTGERTTGPEAVKPSDASSTTTGSQAGGDPDLEAVDDDVDENGDDCPPSLLDTPEFSAFLDRAPFDLPRVSSNAYYADLDISSYRVTDPEYPCLLNNDLGGERQCRRRAGSGVDGL